MRQAEQYGLPLGLYTYDDKLRDQLNSALYVAQRCRCDHRPGRADLRVLRGRSNRSEDLPLRRQLRFAGRGRRNPGRQDHRGASRLAGGLRRSGRPPRRTPLRAWSTRPKARSRVWRRRRLAAVTPLHGPLSWAGVQDQYFAAIFLPDLPRDAALVTLHHSITVPKDPAHPDPNKVDTYQVLGAAVGNTNGCDQRAAVCRS